MIDPNKGNEVPSAKQSYGKEGQDAMDKFKKKWKTWTPEQKLDTLLNMILGIGYRIDILASVVTGIPDVQKMEQEAAKAAIVAKAKPAAKAKAKAKVKNGT